MHFFIRILFLVGHVMTSAIGKDVCSKMWDDRGTRYTLVQNNEGVFNWLFVPGGPGADASYFLPLIEKLHLPGKTWLVDFPDNGSNVQNQDKREFDDWTDCVLDMVERFENPIYVGHSFGGMLALMVPELEHVLQGLIIIGSCPILDTQEIEKIVEEKNIVVPKEPGKRFQENPNEENFRAVLFAVAPRHFPVCSVEVGRTLFSSLPFNFHAMVWGYTKISSYQAQWIPQHLPTLIMGGSEDCINPISIFVKDQRFHRENIALVVLQGAGHFPWFESGLIIKKLFDDYVEKLNKKLNFK